MTLPESQETILHLQAGAVRGGCEVDCERFIRHTPDLRHLVIVLAEPGPMSDVWQSAGAEVRHWPPRLDQFFPYFRVLRRNLPAVTARRVIVWTPIRVPLLLAALKRHAEFVLLHAGNPLPRRPLLDFKQTLLGWLLGRPRDVAVVACSEQVAENYQRHAYLRQFPCFACFNPIELPAATVRSPRPLRRDDAIRLGMVARLDRIKDHATVLRAFAGIRRQFPRAVLELAGDGERRRDLQQLAAELGVADAVRFLGFVPDVKPLLAEWDLVLYGTTPWEGLGNALAEAMAFERPCVVSDLPVMRELVGSEHAARFVPPGDPAAMTDAAIALLDDPGARQQLARHARARIASAFDPARIAAFHRRFLRV